MKFVLTAGWDDGIADLTERLVKELAGNKKVLWLISGGSNIPASTQIMHNIPTNLSHNLTVILADERYGKVGHIDSNWHQLQQAGFDSKQAKCVEILSDELNLDQTEQRYNEIIKSALDNNDVVIGQLGVGPDGHIAGILIDSPAANVDDRLVTSYTSEEEPPLCRLTLTFEGLRNIDAAYCFAFGEPKKQTLRRLQKTRLPLTTQPAQILKNLNECYLYNDQVGHHGR